MGCNSDRLTFILIKIAHTQFNGMIDSDHEVAIRPKKTTRTANKTSSE